MSRKVVNAQISNGRTLAMYKRQMLNLAENVFEFVNLPKFIDVSYMNSQLVRKGQIAFFYDDILDELLALPFVSTSTLDVYGRPLTVQVIGQNGYSRFLKQGEFVIMYDNNGRYPIYLDILQYAERVARDTIVSDINIDQQKTPRVWTTTNEKYLTVKNLLNNYDGSVESILASDDLDIEDINCIVEPAPFVADKVDMHKEKDWNEFLRLIGVANMNFQKKERNIKDEVLASQGGTIASRYNRFEPRKKAIELINEKFGKYLPDGNIEVRFYDNLPTTLEEKEETFEESEVYEDEQLDQ